MLHQYTKSQELLGSRKQVRLHLCCKQYNVFKYSTVFQWDNESELNSDKTKLLENTILNNKKRATTKYKHTHIFSRIL